MALAIEQLAKTPSQEAIDDMSHLLLKVCDLYNQNLENEEKAMTVMELKLRVETIIVENFGLNSIDLKELLNSGRF